MPTAQTWYEIVLPPVVTLAVVVVGLVLLWAARGYLRQIVEHLGVQRISAFGVDVQFIEEHAVAAYAKQSLGPPSQDDRAAIRDASRFLAPLAAQSRVLWVDDDPANNASERSMFLSLEIDVQSERTTNDAIRELEDPRQRSRRSGVHPTYISDIERGARNPSWAAIVKLTDGLGAPVAELAAAYDRLSTRA